MTEEKKPGWKTSEFWITLVVLAAAAVLAAGVVGEGSGLAKVLLGVMAMAQSLGYTTGRAFLKAQEAAGTLPPGTGLTGVGPAKE